MKYFLLLFLIACTLTKIVDVRPLNSGVKKNIKKTYRIDRKIEQNLVQKKRLKKFWDEHGGNSRYDGYLEDLLKQKAVIQVEKNELKKYFESHPIYKVKKLTSRDKYYDQVNSYESKLKDYLKDLSRAYDKYQDIDEDCMDFIKDKKVYLVQTGKVKKDFNLRIKKSRKSLNSASKYLTAFKKKNPEHKTEVVKEIESKVEAIKKELTEMNDFFQMVMTELNGAKSNFVVPGMKAHSYIDSLKKHQDKMEDLVDDYHAAVKKLD